MSTAASVPFELTPLWLDVKTTILSGSKPVKFDTRIQLHTPSNDVNILRVTEIEESADYVKDFCQTMHIRFMIGLGDYVYKLYPYRNLIEVSVKKVPQTMDSGTDYTHQIETVRYRGVLNLTQNPALTGKRITNQDCETLNQNQIVEVLIELVDRNLEVLRVANVLGGVYPNVTPERLIAGLMTSESNKYQVDGKPAIEAFNIVEPDNTTPIKQAIIPSGKRLVEIPLFIQQMLQGVYSAGIGTFFQRYNNKPGWFVYPLYNPNTFDKDVERVVLFAVPEDKLSGIDVTYRKEGKILYIAVTGQQQYYDDSQISDLNAGVGFRLPSADAIMNKPVHMTDDGPLADRASVNTEVGNRTRPDGLYLAPMKSPSSNPFKHYSKVAARQMAELNLVWENSHPDLIYPGMPCKYVFMDNGEYKEVRGVILGKYSVEALIGNPVTSQTYRTSTHLGLCVEYYENSPEQPATPSYGKF